MCGQREERGETTVVAVVGMHRSGTSWLAGELQTRGLELGEVSERNPHNRKGNRENRTIGSIHERVLRDSGGSWSKPPRSVTWTASARSELQSHVASMSRRYERWGFKDPRTLLVLDEWRQLVGGLQLVGIARHPLAVAQSLSARN